MNKEKMILILQILILILDITLAITSINHTLNGRTIEATMTQVAMCILAGINCIFFALGGKDNE